MRSGVIYKISCYDCNATYIGQTKRLLRTRITEPKKDIDRIGTPLVVFCHRLDSNHRVDWKGVSILDTEGSYQKRLISEMIHINRQNFGLNKRSDPDFLSEMYIPILNLLLPH